MNDNCLIEKFNCNCKYILDLIDQSYPVPLHSRFYYLDFRTRKKKRFYPDTNTESHDFLNYYWMEFSYQHKAYKLSMYYKDMDHRTGNLHVLPGAIQLWEAGTCSHFIDDRSLSLYEYYCSPFEEYHWRPIFKRPLFWNLNQISDVTEYIHNLILNDRMTEYPHIQNYCSKGFYSEINPFFERLHHDKLHLLMQQDNGHSYRTGQGISSKYYLYRWIDIDFYKSCDNPFYTLYRTENYNGLGVFTKFGEWYYHHGAPNRFCNITKKWLIHLDEEPPPKPLTETKFHLVPKDTSTDPQI